jgi:hypothetical protein
LRRSVGAPMIAPQSAQWSPAIGSTSQKLTWMPPSWPGTGLPRMLMSHWVKNGDMIHPAV